MTEYMDILDTKLLLNDFVYNLTRSFRRRIRIQTFDTVQKTKLINVTISGFLRNRYHSYVIYFLYLDLFQIQAYSVCLADPPSWTHTPTALQSPAPQISQILSVLLKQG